MDKRKLYDRWVDFTMWVDRKVDRTKKRLEPWIKRCSEGLAAASFLVFGVCILTISTASSEQVRICAGYVGLGVLCIGSVAALLGLFMVTVLLEAMVLLCMIGFVVKEFVVLCCKTVRNCCSTMARVVACIGVAAGWILYGFLIGSHVL